MFSLTMNMVTSLSKNPNTLKVANSRLRSEMLIFVKLYNTTNASVPDKTMKMMTIEFMPVTDFSSLDRWVSV